MDKIVADKLYWKDIFKNEHEFFVYQYLCDNSRKKYSKKLTEDLKFDRYKSWEEYIKNLYIGRNNLEQLDEFSRYLNNRIRKTGFSNGMLKTVLAPLMVVGVTEFFKGYFNLAQKIQEFNINTMIQEFIIASISDKMIMILIIIFLLIILFGLPIGLGLSMYMVIDNFNEVEQKQAFYKDYKEVIDSIIKEMKD